MEFPKGVRGYLIGRKKKMATWKLTDSITNETVFICNDQLKESIDKMRKMNKRMCCLFDTSIECESRGNHADARMYEDWANEMHYQTRGMLDMFRMLTCYELSDVSLLHDPITKMD